MKWNQLEYSRTFNLGNYESERITLSAEFDESAGIDESFKTLKAKVLSLHESGKLIEESKAVAESADRLAPIKESFPKELANMLFFEESKDAVIIKPKEFLGSQNFAKIAAFVRDLNGEYVSEGKQSHFKVPKK